MQRLVFGIDFGETFISCSRICVEMLGIDVC